MIYYTVLICLLIFGYIYLISLFTTGWLRIKEYKKGWNNPSSFFISLIIAVRNEEENILQLFKSLSKQSLNKKYFEIILVNDHSTDNTLNRIKFVFESFSNFQILNTTDEKGKKSAIELGIKNAKGNLIVTTDADCLHHKNWLETIADFYCEYKPKLIIGPVLMKGTNFFEKLQALDFFAMMAAGAGASGKKKPILCNGANLAFEKETYLTLGDPHNKKYRSGDDIFLLLNLKKEHKFQIRFLKSNNAVVFTKAEKSINNLIKQRIRWASKSTGYKDGMIIITSLIVLLMNSLLLLNLLLSAFQTTYIYIFIIQFFLKSMIDFLFLFITGQYFNQKKLLVQFIPAQLTNILFVPLIAIASLLGTKK